MTSEQEKLLQSKYLHRLPDKLSDLQDLRSQNESAKLQSAVHKLAGSAGMYGFESISEIAAEIEGLLVVDEPLISDKFQQLFDSLIVKIDALVSNEKLSDD